MKIPNAAPTIWADTVDGRKFPLRRIFCVGRNYGDHAKEMGGNPDREPPFFFTKWAQAVVPSGTAINYPQQTSNYHYEGELVVALGAGGRFITPAAALDHVWGYAAGLDMTRRDLQQQARGQGRPWDVAKNVEQSAPLGPLHPAAEFGAPSHGALTLFVNGEQRQKGDLADMIWPVADIISILSGYYPLEPGDLIFTGTPAGVGPVQPGDRIEVVIDRLSPLIITIGNVAP